jgi:hypothetical protein
MQQFSQKNLSYYFCRKRLTFFAPVV